MDYITTTELRTKSSELLSSLEKGAKVSLVHRSKVIGIIEPKSAVKPRTFSVKKFQELFKKPTVPDTLTHEDRDRIYREYLEKKYGEDIS